MDRLWAPWRLRYIQQKKAKKCVFCSCAKDKKADFLIFTSRHSTAILNIYPYNNGHIMISPKRHVRDLAGLQPQELTDIFKSLLKAQGLLKRVLKPDGFNIGMNIGKSAGAGIQGHIHIHIVPRWAADTNFMPAISNSRVISQSLQELKKLLKDAQSKKD